MFSKINSKPLKNIDHCPFCNEGIALTGGSLHIWEVEYKCGYKIRGAVDIETHGNNIEVVEKCSKKKFS